MAELQGTLPTLPPSSNDPSSDDISGDTEPSINLDKPSSFEDADEKPHYVNGEPVINGGRDVSRYLVDLRDDQDPPITFRSVVLGTVIGGLGAALYQIYIFKPLSGGVSTVFLLLIIYTLGVFWSTFLPKRSWVEGTRFEWLGPALDFINPGAFRLKEHVVASIIASSASYGSTSVLNFAVQRVRIHTKVRATTAVLATFSTAVFGYGIVGLLRPLTVYPSEMNLPNVSIFQGLHFNTAANHKRVRLFWTAFAAMFTYEIIPAYMFPFLNGFNIFCLSSQHASPSVQDAFTNIFGGADSNEGLGLFSLSFDWQYIGSEFMSRPIIQQANSWVGFFFSYVAIAAIYYSNTWSSKSFPMLSTSLFSSNGSIYHQKAVFTGPDFKLNQTALDQVGLPALTGSYAWSGLMSSLAIGGLIAHCLFFWGPYVLSSFKHAREKTQPDPHWVAMQKYEEVPWWWYVLLLVLAFFAGLISVLHGETTLPVWSYIVALISGAIVTPFSTLLFARMGNGIATNQVFKMIAGSINPGRPVANLYFSMWSHDVVGTSIGLASDLKMGQYLKIPPRAMFLSQIYGTIIVVMIAITGAQRELLLEPNGNNIWSGIGLQSLNSNAITWSLAGKLYGPSGPYFVIPLGIFISFGATFVHWLVCKASGITSTVGSSILVGLTSQLWLRRYHPGWYRKYNYILVMIFILSFAVFGASGVSRPFPSWAGNPTQGNVDYCNGNGALSQGA
ncbi:oligopeptide transporter [Russula ochroleuca]|uniref:Oligopeptide transporter n=1 Tax=Russula ochroleuca TaxID=152965 RepID=A0A9P5MKN5_9AGAM|nr:oligopeptide transporter [Russula ochroleuca]